MFPLRCSVDRCVVRIKLNTQSTWIEIVWDFIFVSDYVIMHSWVICLPVWLFRIQLAVFHLVYWSKYAGWNVCYCFMQFWIFQWKLNRNSQQNANLNVNLKNGSRFSAINFMFSISDMENMLTTRLQLPKMSISWQFILSYACYTTFFFSSSLV